MSNLKKSEENEKLRITLLTALNKMNSSSTIKVCHETIKKLIIEEEKNENKINFILNTIADHINHLQKGERKESIKLLSTVCLAIKHVSGYLSRLLTIIQTNITEENSSIFTGISTSFGEIVDYTTNKSEEKSNVNYELLQGFCIYNMKLDKKSNQICGSLCLTSLIENSAMVLEPAYMKYIWENIIYFIDKNNFHAKSELINSLISLIFASENLFRPFATVTLYKILDFLTDGDWLKRKLALNVVYTLGIYAQDEITPLKAHIVEFLKVLKCDKIKEVREVCMQTLKLFYTTTDDDDKLDSYDEECEEEMEDEEEVKVENIRDSVEKNVRQVMEKVEQLTETPKSNKNMNVKDSNMKSPVFKEVSDAGNKKFENEISKIEKKSVNGSKLDLDNSNLNELIGVKDLIIEEKKSNKKNLTQTPIKVISYDSKKSVGKNPKNVNGTQPICESSKPSNKNTTLIRHKTQKVLANKNNSFLNGITKVSEKSMGERLDTENVNINKKEMKSNRNTDNTNVNSKINIKRDPKRSIFKTQANRDFFSKPKNGDIQVLFKDQLKTANKSEDEELVISELLPSRESKPEIENNFKIIEDPEHISKQIKNISEKEMISDKNFLSVNIQSNEKLVKDKEDDHRVNDNFKLNLNNSLEGFQYNTENFNYFTERDKIENIENYVTLGKRDSDLIKIPSDINLNNTNIKKKDSNILNHTSDINDNNYIITEKDSFNQSSHSENKKNNYLIKKESFNYNSQSQSNDIKTNYVQIKKKESFSESINSENSSNNFVQVKKKESFNQNNKLTDIENKNYNNFNYLTLNKNESISQISSPENININNSEPIKKNILTALASPIPQHNKIDLSDLLIKMKAISEKQIFLVDTIEKTQENTKDHFEVMNKRIIYLENTVNLLLSYIESNNLQPQPYNTSRNNSKNPYKTTRYETNVTKKQNESIQYDSLIEDNTNKTSQLNNYSIKTNSNSNTDSNYTTKINSRMVDIYAELKNKNPNEAFNIALNGTDETSLIKLIEKVTISQIKETDENIIEDAVIRLVSLLLRGENSNLIVPFLKNVIVTGEVTLKASLIQNIRDILIHIPKNKEKYNLTNDELVDINLILTYINTKASKLVGYSTLIQFNSNDV